MAPAEMGSKSSGLTAYSCLVRSILVNEIDHRSGDSDLNQNYSQEGNLSANVDLTQHAHIESR